MNSVVSAAVEIKAHKIEEVIEISQVDEDGNLSTIVIPFDQVGWVIENILKFCK